MKRFAAIALLVSLVAFLVLGPSHIYSLRGFVKSVADHETDQSENTMALDTSSENADQAEVVDQSSQNGEPEVQAVSTSTDEDLQASLFGIVTAWQPHCQHYVPPTPAVDDHGFVHTRVPGYCMDKALALARPINPVEVNGTKFQLSRNPVDPTYTSLCGAAGCSPALRSNCRRNVNC